MANYPTAGLQQSSKRVALKESVRSQTEGGYTFSRAKFTGVKYKFTLDHLLTKSEFDSLETFFILNQGKTVSLTFEGNTYNVIFTIDELDYQRLSLDVYKLTVEMVEQ